MSIVTRSSSSLRYDRMFTLRAITYKNKRWITLLAYLCFKIFQNGIMIFCMEYFMMRFIKPSVWASTTDIYYNHDIIIIPVPLTAWGFMLSETWKCQLHVNASRKTPTYWNILWKEVNDMEKITVEFANPMLYDRLHTLSTEYSIPVELLINTAVKRLIDDVDFVRNLRTGTIRVE